MKRILSLILIIVLMFSSFVYSASANETDAENPPGGELTPEGEIPPDDELPPEETEERFMCDIDGDGDVSAADARIILRTSVGLDKIAIADILYADADFDGAVKASDARLALRTSVGLEEKKSEKFEIISQQEATCILNGSITAKNAEGKTVEFSTSALGHVLDRYAACYGEGVCEVCGELVKCSITHSYPENEYCLDTLYCAVCGQQKAVVPQHKFKDYECSVCGAFDRENCYKNFVEYVKKNGKYEDGLYYCEDSDEYAYYALCYEANSDLLYLYCGFAVDTNGTVMTYNSFTDISKNFSGYVTEIDCYLEDDFVAYGIYSVSAPLLNDSIQGSLFQKEYDSIPELSNMQSQIMIIAEGALYESISWLLRYAEKTGIKGITADLMDFTSLQ